MYEMKIQVRYSEVDRSGKVNLHQLLEYLQDCVTFHSIDVGLGIRGDEKEGRAWYLIAWDILVYRRPELAEILLNKNRTECVTAQDIARLAAHQSAGRKGCPADAVYTVVLNKADSEKERHAALEICRMLAGEGIRRIIVTGGNV